MPEKRRQATSALEPLTEPPGPLCEHVAPDDAERHSDPGAFPIPGGDAAPWRPPAAPSGED